MLPTPLPERAWACRSGLRRWRRQPGADRRQWREDLCGPQGPSGRGWRLGWARRHPSPPPPQLVPHSSSQPVTGPLDLQQYHLAISFSWVSFSPTATSAAISPPPPWAICPLRSPPRPARGPDLWAPGISPPNGFLYHKPCKHFPGHVPLLFKRRWWQPGALKWHNGADSQAGRRTPSCSRGMKGCQELGAWPHSS
uniref:Uncharacterized protein n=1 Tax=Rousettus aegyptiacus TaxID=9407 RepID=A0A7J8DIH9_ROUAE|nr:hypothetical protein HJG63_008717 [Rousettus aegyptiacus]